MEDLEEELYWLEETLGEHETQYRSECALFGDAGPGQFAHIQYLRTVRASLLRRIELRRKASTH